MASAWLIRRFIDPAGALPLAGQAEGLPGRCAGLRFRRRRLHPCRRARDLRGAAGELRPGSRPGPGELAALVHCLDVGGVPVAEAAGVEMVLAGLRASLPDDDALLAAAGGVFDGIYMNLNDRRINMSETNDLHAPRPPHLLGGLRLLAQARLHQLRRPRRADRHHAPGTGGETPLDLRAPLPARAQLLHGAARPGGAAARHLHRLADAPHLGRHRRRHAVRAALAVHPGRR